MNVGSDFDFTQIMSVMVIFASTMIIYFYRKGWIGPQK
jgi:Mg2+ and Co2+ transporter CorA